MKSMHIENLMGTNTAHNYSDKPIIDFQGEFFCWQLQTHQDYR